MGIFLQFKSDVLLNLQFNSDLQLNLDLLKSVIEFGSAI